MERRPRASWTRHGRSTCLSGMLALALLAGCERGPTLDPALANEPLPAVDSPVDDALADAGAWYFQRNCVACHSIGGGDAVGPDLAGVTERRSLPWIEAMVRRPDSMVVADSVARELLVRYQVPMIDRGLDGARIRAILEFLRRADRGAPEAPSRPLPNAP